MQRLTSFYLDTDGEVFALWTDDAGFPQIQVLESWRIDKPTVADDRVFDGVQLDTQGRVLGYWLDGETFLDANALVHLFDLERYTQYRGMSPIRRGANDMRDGNDVKAFQKVLSKLSTVLTLAIQGAPLEENPGGSPTEPAGEASTEEETPAETNEKQRSFTVADLVAGDIPTVPEGHELKQVNTPSAPANNIEVVEAIIDKTKQLTMDGEVLNKEGNILTLTDRQAAKEYGSPPTLLLSLGTVESLDALLAKLGFAGAQRFEIKPTGAEKLGTWINAIGPLLLIAGIIGLYIEFKTPGFGLPGIVGIAAFALYFFGGYVSGLSGAGWAAMFVVGLILVGLEWFVFPSTFIAGISGGVLMLVAIVMAMVDRYPGAPSLPTLPQLRLPLQDICIAITISFVLALILARFLPKTSLFRKLVSQSTSGVSSVAAQEEQREARIGQFGVTISQLYPGGKARFGEQTLDVLTEGELVEKGRRVRIIGHTGADAVVKEAD